MVVRAARCGGCSTSVLWHLLSSEKEDGRCRLPSRPNLSMSPCAIVDVSCMAWRWTRRGSPPWSATHRLRSDGALHEECAVFGPQGGPADGGGDHPHRLRPARCQERPPAVAKGLGGLPTPVCEARRADGGGRRGCALLRPLPSRALAEDLVQQPA